MSCFSFCELLCLWVSLVCKMFLLPSGRQVIKHNILIFLLLQYFCSSAVSISFFNPSLPTVFGFAHWKQSSFLAVSCKSVAFWGQGFAMLLLLTAGTGRRYLNSQLCVDNTVVKTHLFLGLFSSHPTIAGISINNEGLKKWTKWLKLPFL